MEIPHLLWEMDTMLLEQFKLEELLVKRVLKYDSRDDESVLHLTEIQSLQVESRTVDGRSKTLFLTDPDNDDDPAERLTTWWEASVSSVKLDKAFEENNGLELGDAPTWTLEDLLASEVTAALCVPACDMVKQMDVVGQYNYNRVSQSALEKNNREAPNADKFW